MHIDLLEERARTDRIITGFAQVMGNENVELVELVKVRADYDAFLNAPPDAPVDIERLELMQVLGIAKK